MRYFALEFSAPESDVYLFDLLAQDLADIGFESFQQEGLTLKAFVAEDRINQVNLDTVLENYSFQSPRVDIIEEQNWNSLWESNFEPVEIGSAIHIRASFHPVRPGFTHELVIDPKMAFGTGHHATTWLMAREMLGLDLSGKRVIDMGCGSGILAILACKLGASSVLAVDFDRVCTDSTLENALANNCPGIVVVTGESGALDEGQWDVILANINRNVLLAQIPDYANHLVPEGKLILSGFYENDLSQLREACLAHQLVFDESYVKDNWVLAKFTKA